MALASKPIRVEDLATHLGREGAGDRDFLISGVAALENAGAGDLSFVRSPNLIDAASRSHAGALIVPEGVDPGGRPAILSPHPALDFARAVARIVPGWRPAPGVHPEAVVDPGAEVDASASISAGCVVGPGCSVAARTVLHPRVVLYPGVVIGSDCEIHAGTVLREGTEVGERVVLQPGVVVGGDGFGYIRDEDGRSEKVPHVGRVVIEDDVEVGANTTIDRAALFETRIRRGAKIDNLVQIAHNCDIGEHAVVAAQTGLSGSTVIGKAAMVMGQVGSAGHLRVGDGAFVGTRTGLHRDVPAGSRVWGSPQMEERLWHRSSAALRRLPDVLRRVRALERKLGLRRGSDSEDDG